MEIKVLKEPHVTVLKVSALRADLEKIVCLTKGKFVYKLFFFFFF